MSVQPAYRSESWELLDNTMEALGRFVQDVSTLVHVALDEFQEITEITDSLRIEGRLRHYIQSMKCGFVFVGSRRRILLDMFNNRKRPFFQSTISYEIGTLPREELVDFMVAGFEHSGRALSRDLGKQVCDLVGRHPYYIQKFCFFLFNRVERSVTPDEISDTYRMLLESERALFESLIRRLTVTQIAVLTAIAKEPTNKLFPTEYMERHRLKSTGGIQRSLSVLTAEDLVEQIPEDGVWTVVDPLFRQWLVEKAL